MLNLNKKKLLITFLVIIVISFFTYRYLLFSKKIDHLKRNYIVTTCIIESLELGHRAPTAYANYSFSFKGKHYKGYRGLDGITYADAQSNFIKESFPIIVDTLMPENNAILVTPDHFNKMGWKYPDSLEWVMDYYVKDFYTNW